MPSRFIERLATGAPLVLDAAMGSDLDRRGVTTTLPLWSAIGLLGHPDVVRQIHIENLLAGADIVTTNTFRSTARTLHKAGLDPARAAELDALAVQLAGEAKAAADRPDAFIAGSIAPLDECYDPVFTTDHDLALTEHRAQARNLAEAGVDFLMIETIPTVAEAAIAVRAASESGLPVTVGFVCGPGPDGDARLLSGETLAEAVKAVSAYPVAMLIANCAAPAVITSALTQMRTLSDLPLGGYANLGQIDEAVGWNPDGALNGAAYADAARPWLDLRVRVIGGCCGTHAAHTAALRAMVDASEVRTA